MFWHGDMIRKKRKHLVSAFYKSTAPEEWKRGYKEKKSRKRKKLRTCKNPFHYLERWCDLSGQLKSRCACSDNKVVQKQTQSMDIRKFFQYPKLNMIAFQPAKWIVEKNISALSRSDLINSHMIGVRKERERRSYDLNIALTGIISCFWRINTSSIRYFGIIIVIVVIIITKFF